MKDRRMLKYLVTGGLGFIGSHLAHLLVKKGFEVVILDNLSTGKKENAPQEARLIVGDLNDKNILKEAVKGIDGCFHLAAVASIEESVKKWAASHKTNMLGTISLLEALLENKIPLVFTSSAAIYGDPAFFPIKESFSPRPLSPYGLDKLNAEKHLQMASELYGLPVTIFRLFNVYGPRQNPSSHYSGVITIFSNEIQKSKKVTIFGKGDQMRDFIYVEDVVKFLYLAMEKNKEGHYLYNLCRGEGTTIEQLVLTFEKIYGVAVKKEYQNARKSDILISIGDPSKMEKHFGQKAEISLEQGLRKLNETLHHPSYL